MTRLRSGMFTGITSVKSPLFSTPGLADAFLVAPQMLDDCGPSLTFAKADIYNDAKIVLHKDRVLRHSVLPYEYVRILPQWVPATTGIAPKGGMIFPYCVVYPLTRKTMYAPVRFEASNVLH